MSRAYKLHKPDGLYFITFATVAWVDVFTRRDYKDIVVDSLRFCQKEKGLLLFAWVIMSNHMHLIARGAEGHDISAIIRDFKKFTSKAIVQWIQEGPESRKDWLLRHMANRASQVKRVKEFKFWEDGNHAILLDTADKWAQRMNYLHNNPVTAGLVREAEDYVFSSACDYSGGSGLVKVELAY